MGKEKPQKGEAGLSDATQQPLEVRGSNGLCMFP
jgi:hypothetical protein